MHLPLQTENLKRLYMFTPVDGKNLERLFTDMSTLPVGQSYTHSQTNQLSPQKREQFQSSVSILFHLAEVLQISSCSCMFYTHFACLRKTGPKQNGKSSRSGLNQA